MISVLQDGPSGAPLQDEQPQEPVPMLRGWVVLALIALCVPVLAVTPFTSLTGQLFGVAVATSAALLIADYVRR